VFVQVLGQLEQISQELIPGTLEAQRAVELFNDAARAERLCSAIKSRLARRIEETKVWRESGHRSAAHWLAEATGATVGAAARTLETARALEQLPERTPRSVPVSSPTYKRLRSPRQPSLIRPQRPSCSRRPVRRA
jgi:hypothetical protein